MTTVQSTTDWLASSVLEFAGPQVTDLWALRPDIRQYVQACYEAAFAPADEGQLPVALRFALAQNVAALSGSTLLADAYGRELAAAGTYEESELTAALFEYSTMVTLTPVDSSMEWLERVRASGATDTTLVTATLITGFVTYQVRAIAGLTVIGETL
jgi:uncharacterized protein YciW